MSGLEGLLLAMYLVGGVFVAVVYPWLVQRLSPVETDEVFQKLCLLSKLGGLVCLFVAMLPPIAFILSTMRLVGHYMLLLAPMWLTIVTGALVGTWRVRRFRISRTLLPKYYALAAKPLVVVPSSRPPTLDGALSVVDSGGLSEPAHR